MLVGTQKIKKGKKRRVPETSAWGSGDARTHSQGIPGKGCRFRAASHPQEARRRTGFGRRRGRQEPEESARRTRMEAAGEGGTAGASGAVPAPEGAVGSKGSEKQTLAVAVAVAGNRRPCHPFQRDRGTI